RPERDRCVQTWQLLRAGVSAAGRFPKINPCARASAAGIAIRHWSRRAPLSTNWEWFPVRTPSQTRPANLAMTRIPGGEHEAEEKHASPAAGPVPGARAERA